MCPVAIDIPRALAHLREKVPDQGVRGHYLEKAAMKATSWVMDHPAVVAAGEWAAARTRALHPKRPLGAGAWTESRDLPELPEES
ncbi:lactate utilization protein LutB domain-containing protein [Streptomyces sp. NPDC006530]|uniref:lactate utilisation protein LutB domain-containing protein n=1 Tax=Streptomyces sp. NPDC006530 TaxID=3364750 RepID=UPI003689A268